MGRRSHVSNRLESSFGHSLTRYRQASERSLVDIAKGEKVEADLTHLIERRHDQRVVEEGHRPSEEMYEESTRRYQEQMRVRARYEWHAFHCGQAERHRRTLQELIEHHEEQAEKYRDQLTKGDAA